MTNTKDLEFMQKLLPNAKFVNSNGERVADVSKTIWKFKIKQDNLTVVRGQAEDKEDAIGECLHYVYLYAEEDFSKMVIEIKKDEKDVAED